MKWILLIIVPFIGFFVFWGFSAETVQNNFDVMAQDLVVPWDIAFLPDGSMLVTERPGRLLHLSKTTKTILIESAIESGEGGLMGIALHPNFAQNHWIYLYYSTKKGNSIINRVERFHFENEIVDNPKIIIDDIPGEMYHDGGRIAFGPDGYLYLTTGDAGDELLAQDVKSLAGKILRLRDDGSLPSDNPFGNAVYSYGHRNPQGLTWDASGGLWSTEHGRSGFLSGYDELNLIEKGKNYGWPLIQGPESASGLQKPALQSGSNVTWAPASALYWNGSIFFGGLRGEALYEAQIDKSPIVLKEHFKGQFGRIRTVVLGPDGLFYFTTSNRDGRGMIQKGDDKIIKVDPQRFRK